MELNLQYHIIYRFVKNYMNVGILIRGGGEFVMVAKGVDLGSGNVM